MGESSVYQPPAHVQAGFVTSLLLPVTRVSEALGLPTCSFGAPEQGCGVLIPLARKKAQDKSGCERAVEVPTSR